MKKGDMVVKVIVGGGVKTCSIVQVSKVSKGVISLLDDGIKYDTRTLREIDPAIFGFYSELIPFAGGEVDKWELDR